MTKYELYCMIFLALDADWDDTKNYDLGQFLSSANPFLFKGIGSAVPDIYTEYINYISGYELTRENSYEIAHNYVQHLKEPAVIKSFETLKKEQWDDALRDYLASDHVSGE